MILTDEQIIYMQLPVVTILVLTSRAAAQTLNSRAFGWLGVSWLLNLLYLVCHLTQARGLQLNGFQVDARITDSLTSVSSVAFFIAGRRFVTRSRRTRILRIPLSLIILMAAAAIGTTWALRPGGAPPSNPLWIGVPRATLDTLTIWSGCDGRQGLCCKRSGGRKRWRATISAGSGSLCASSASSAHAIYGLELEPYRRRFGVHVWLTIQGHDPGRHCEAIRATLSCLFRGGRPAR